MTLLMDAGVPQCPLLGSTCLGGRVGGCAERPEATIAGEMFKQAALKFVGEPVTGIAETKDPGDVALDGALVRQRNGIDDAAQKAALREARLSAGTIC